MCIRDSRISGVPICENNRLVGIITNRDLKFEDDMSKPIREVMTKEGLITAPVGTTLEEAKAILRRHKIEKLPLVDEQFALKGPVSYTHLKSVLTSTMCSSRRRRWTKSTAPPPRGARSRWNRKAPPLQAIVFPRQRERTAE